MNRVLTFFKDNSYYMVKMFIDQFVMSVFGTMVSIATLKNAKLLLAASVFSVLFYLVILYTVGWEIGTKDKIKIDGGRMSPMPMKGAYIALGSQIPNYFAVLVLFIGIVGKFAAVSVFSNAAIRLFNGMYLGIFTLLEKAAELTIESIWWWYLVMTLPTVLVGFLSYFAGTKNFRFAEFFGLKRTPTEQNNHSHSSVK